MPNIPYFRLPPGFRPDVLEEPAELGLPPVLSPRMRDPDIVFHYNFGTYLFRMDPDGTHIRMIISYAEHAQYSRDNSKIAFGSPIYDGGLQIINSDGSNIFPLYPYGSKPTWSPDGTKLAFQFRYALTDHRIYIINIDGSDPHQLLSESAYNPSWSPDGSRIAYAKLNGGINMINPDGSDDIQICETGIDPCWSPSGREIAYVSFSRSQSYPSSEQYYIWIMNHDGTDNRMISSGQGRSPSWSPDGRKLVYEGVSLDQVTYMPNPEFEWGRGRSSLYTGIWMVSRDGSNERQILNFGYHPEWSNPPHL